MNCKQGGTGKTTHEVSHLVGFDVKKLEKSPCRKKYMKGENIKLYKKLYKLAFEMVRRNLD